MLMVVVTSSERKMIIKSEGKQKYQTYFSYKAVTSLPECPKLNDHFQRGLFRVSRIKSIPIYYNKIIYYREIVN